MGPQTAVTRGHPLNSDDFRSDEGRLQDSRVTSVAVVGWPGEMVPWAFFLSSHTKGGDSYEEILEEAS
jgi:hypothetical protein